MGPYAFLIIAAAVISSAAAMLVSFAYGRVSRELSDARGELAELRGRTIPGIEARAFIPGSYHPIFQGNSEIIHHILTIEAEEPHSPSSRVNNDSHNDWQTIIDDSRTPVYWEFRPVNLSMPVTDDDEA